MDDPGTDRVVIDYDNRDLDIVLKQLRERQSNWILGIVFFVSALLMPGVLWFVLDAIPTLAFVAYFSLLLAFWLAFVMTSGLLGRLHRSIERCFLNDGKIPSRQKANKDSGLSEFPMVFIWVLGAAALVGVCAAIDLVPIRFRVFVFGICYLPILFTIALPCLLDKATRRKTLVRIAWAVVVFGFLVIALTVLDEVTDINLVRRALEWVPYRNEGEKLISTIVLALPPLLFALTVLRLLRITKEDASDASKDSEPEDGEEGVEPSEVAGLHAFATRLKELIEQAKNDGGSGELNGLRPGDFRGIDGQAVWDHASAWEWLFPDYGVPTQDQSRFLDRVLVGDLTDPECRSRDYLLEGVKGSGRTTSMIALSGYVSMMLCGRVLWVCPSERRAKAIAARVIAYRESLGGEELFSVSIAEDDFPAGISGVVFITPESLERNWRRFARSVEGRSEMERFLTALEFIFVDDIQDFDSSVRRHLVFIIDKIKALRATMLRNTRMVMSSLPVADSAMHYLYEHFSDFGQESERERFKVLPAPKTIVWPITIDPNSREDVAVAIARLALQQGLSVLLFRDGIDDRDRQGLLSQVVSERGRSEDFTKCYVCGDTDEAVNVTADVSIIIYDGDIYQNLATALFCPSSKEGQLLLELRPEGQPKVKEAHAIFPVLNGSHEYYMQGMHLLSLASFLKEREPVPLKYLARLGLPIDSEEEYCNSEDAVLKAKWLLDGYKHSDNLVQHELSCACLDSAVYVESGIEFHLPPDFSFKWHIDDGEMDIYRVPLGESQHARLIDWKARGETRVSYLSWQSDIAYTRSLKSPHAGRMWVAENVQLQNGSIHVDAELWKGFLQPHVPNFQLKWCLDAGGECAIPFAGSPREGFHLSGYRSVHSSGTVLLKMSFYQLYSDHRQVSSREMNAMSAAYDAHVSLMSLFPKQLPRTAVYTKALAKLWDGEWDTSADMTGSGGAWRFAPELTAAISFALDARAPGLLSRCRLSVFSALDTANAPAHSVMYIHEPWEAGRSAAFILEAILEARGERPYFWGLVLWYLEHLKTLPASERLGLMRGATYCSLDIPGRWMQGESAETRLVDACEQVNSIVQISKGLESTEPYELPDSQLPGDPRDLIEPERSPVVPWVDEPDSAVSWEECLTRMWERTTGREKYIQQCFGTGASRHLIFSIELLDGSSDDWDNSAFSHFAGASCQVHEEGTALMLVADQGGSLEAFRNELSEHFPVSMQEAEFMRGRELRLRLWTIPSLDDLSPRVEGEFNTLMLGGYTRDGLLTVREQTPDIWEPPSPTVPAPAPPEPDLPEDIPVGVGEAVKVLDLPASPSLDAESSVTFKWEYRGKHYELKWGFGEKAHSEAYLTFLESLPVRNGNDGLPYFVLYDPYLPAVCRLAEKLKEFCPSDDIAELAQFVLRFIQTLPYKRDPGHKKSDWPRFPSEHLANFGGDCEDSSLCYAALLTHLGIHCALVNLPRHLAVGVDVPASGSYFSKDGRKYYFAETTNIFPLGEACEYSSAELEVWNWPFPEKPYPSTIISVQRADSGDLDVWFAVNSQQAVDVDLMARLRVVSTPFNSVPKSGLSMIRCDGLASGHSFWKARIPWPEREGVGQLRLDVSSRAKNVAAIWPNSQSYFSS